MTGIILAGGQSTRMGTEKGLVMFRGKPLIRYALDVLTPLCTEILISSPAEAYHHFGHEVIPDDISGIGPMGGLFTCLKRSKNKLNLVLSCDMPFVTAEIFQRLIEKRGASLVCVPWHGQEHYEPLCGIYHKDLVPYLYSRIQQNIYKLPDLFKEISFKPVHADELCPDPGRHCFVSINKPEDLAKYQF